MADTLTELYKLLSVIKTLYLDRITVEEKMVTLQASDLTALLCNSSD